MHELTIALEIVEIAKDYAQRAEDEDVKQNLRTPNLPAGRQGSELPAIREIEVEVGEMSGVMIDSLEFALDIAIKNTILEHAKTTIMRIPGKAKCNNCKTEFDLPDLYTFCPECSKYDYLIISGKELRVKSIVVD